MATKTKPFFSETYKTLREYKTLLKLSFEGIKFSAVIFVFYVFIFRYGLVSKCNLRFNLTVSLYSSTNGDALYFTHFVLRS